MRWKQLRTSGALALVAMVLVVACTAGDDAESTSDTSDTTTDSASTETTPAATGPAPGVTDDSIKIGVTYVDVASLVASGLNYDLGEHEAVYNALFDSINAEGGINGRQIEAVFAPIDPTNPAPAEEKCVQLTEDEDVFMVIGFFLNDAVLCPVSLHATAVVGGSMNAETVAQAEAPWLAWLPDTDQPEAVTRAFADGGELDGTVAVYGAERDQVTVEDTVLPVLDELGIDVVETGIMDAPADDPAAVQASVRTIAERFDASGADTIVIVGASGQDWPSAMAENDSYRPKLLFLEQSGARAFYTNAATTDTSVLEGSLLGGGYGPDQARFEEAAMQECVQIATAAGVEVPSPDEVGDDDPSNQPYQAPFQACPDVYLMQAWLEAAGEDLNYGTLAAAIEGLELVIPGDPEARTFGPFPAADGNPTAYLFAWDESAEEYLPVDG